MLRARTIILFFGLISLAACGNAEEKSFYDKNTTPAARAREIVKYPLDKQWRIYHYGWTTAKPTPADMSEAVSLSGEPMLRYILQKLDNSTDDIDYLMAIFTFKKMQKKNTVNICQNEAYLNTIISYRVKIKDSYNRGVYGDQLNALCPEK